MNDHGLTPENLLASLPPALQLDSKMVALATAISEKLSARMEEIDGLIIYPRIDELPEELLDILAHDFKVDWWDPDYTPKEKLATLKNSWYVHKHMGTKAAVEAAISAIYPGTNVVEWYEYDGEPYTFRLWIDSTYESIDPEKHNRVLERVNYYKNLRSHLDGVDYVAQPDGNCCAHGAVAAAGISMKIEAEVSVYGLE